jgi:hypothetical protein
MARTSLINRPATEMRVANYDRFAVRVKGELITAIDSCPSYMVGTEEQKDAIVALDTAMNKINALWNKER